MNTTPIVNQIPCAVKIVCYQRKEAACDQCRSLADRWSTAHRTAIDVDMSEPVLLDVIVSVHYCDACHHYFRIQPPFLHRDGIYTKRVIQKSVDAVFKDGMAYRRVTERMARDFWVQPSEGSIRRWCKQFGATFDFATDYQAWVVNEFSGILCIDEVYQGKLALLLAVDPAAPDGDRLIGYQLINGNVSGEDVTAFCKSLKSAEIEPEQIITDGSTLYPAVLKQVWPLAAHQLCLFHETRQITRAAMKASNQIRRELPVPVNQHGDQWYGGPLTDAPPSEETSELATKRWYWRQWQRHQRIRQVHELAESGMSQRAIARQTGHHRQTVRRWLRQPVPSLPANVPDEIMQTPIILPEKQQRRVEKQKKVNRIHALAEQNLNHSAVAREVGVHRVTVKKWLRHEQPDSSTDSTDSLSPDEEKCDTHLQEVTELLRQHRFLFVRRPDYLSTEEHNTMKMLMRSPLVGERLTTVRSFMEGWYGIWWTDDNERQNPEMAYANYELWRCNDDFLAVPALGRVIRKISGDRFTKIAHFLHHAHWEATSNGAERMGCAFRHCQAPQFNLRTSDAIQAALTIDACLRKQKAVDSTPVRFHSCQRGRQAKVLTC